MEAELMSHARERQAVLVGLALFVGLPIPTASAEAELVYFRAGGRAQLPATVVGDLARLETPEGVLEFPRSTIKAIVPGFWPEREWKARRAKALVGGAAARFAAAWWALENGLTGQAEAMLRQAHDADPHHQPTARMVALLDKLAEPWPELDLNSLRSAAGVALATAKGPHVVLLHQHSQAEAEERIDLLERVLTTYFLVLAAQGIDRPLPSRRLPSVWFAEREDYVRFLHGEGADAFRSTCGYFHPTRNALFTYDSRSASWYRSAAQAIPSRLSPDAQRRRLLLDLERRAVDLGTAAHEMVHQLMANTGFPPHHDDFPYWLHEGFAAQFEVVRGGRWAGLGRIHDIRLADWRRVQPPPALAPLIHDTGFGHGYQRDRYAAAWALVYFLRKEHPGEFLTFLDLLCVPGHDPDARGERTLRAFRAAFGDDLDALEAAWHRYLDALRSPLEEHEPNR
jgi:hypothetical protein